MTMENRKCKWKEENNIKKIRNAVSEPFL